LYSPTKIFPFRLRSRIQLTVFLYILLMSVLLYKPSVTYTSLEIGAKWQSEDLYAPFDFSILKTEDSLKKEKAAIRSAVVPIYRQDSIIKEEVLYRVRGRLQIFNEKINEYQQMLKSAQLQEAEKLENVFFRSEYMNILPKSYYYILDNQWDKKEKAQSKVLLQNIYQKGYIGAIPDSFYSELISVRLSDNSEKLLHTSDFQQNQGLDVYLQEHIARIYPDINEENIKNALLLRQIIKKEIKPNYVLDTAQTQATIRRATNLLSLVYGKQKAGELIIKKGEFITRRNAEIIRSYYQAREIRFGKQDKWTSFFSRLCIIALLSSVLILYLMFNRWRIYSNASRLSLILTVMLLAVGMMVLTIYICENFPPFHGLSGIYLAPVCMVAIVVNSFFDSRTSSMCNIVLALYGSILLQNGTEYTFIQAVTGSVAVYTLRLFSRRQDVFYTLGYIFLAYIVTYISFNWYIRNSLMEIPLGNIILLLFNVSLLMFIYPLIYLLEKIFKVTSDLSYLELLDTNHPLLRELARTAPGTFQHSLQVANLAEAAAVEIQANTLLIHVGALYHDIGKMKNPMYFIENNKDGENPHLKISALESADIIIEHVSYGVELAQKNGLPREVIDFIESHHGTTKVEFFYRTHIVLNPANSADIGRFTYKGPKPQSKETAILMLADSIEAASRSLRKYTVSNLEELVNQIIDYKVKADQFSHSPLTFSDISRIKKVFLLQLKSIYHHRIEYPKED
jgi:cyclic-di-AMP phosphodiesterase PgpH